LQRATPSSCWELELSDPSSSQRLPVTGVR
jgi:hypothetical protein